MDTLAVVINRALPGNTAREAELLRCTFQGEESSKIFMHEALVLNCYSSERPILDRVFPMIGEHNESVIFFRHLCGDHRRITERGSGEDFSVLESLCIRFERILVGQVWA
jgi:hypothetical protein